MGKKIMIVDDAAFMRMTIKNCLTKAGYSELIEAEDGAVAVDKYAAEKPNLTGIEALQKIKAGDAGAKVVMCSAMGQEAMVVEAIQLGALDFIVKPFKPDRILQTVTKILG